MRWQDDIEGVAEALLHRHPGVNPIGLRPSLIAQWAQSLPGCEEDASHLSPRLLERIQAAWHSRYLAQP